MTPIRAARAAGAAGDVAFAREALPAVSRTFAPAIGLLPPGLAHTVRLAYLLCRVADTIEDAPGLTGEARGESLLRFRALLESGSEGEPERFAAEIGGAFPAADAEADLIRSLPRLLAMLDAIPAEPRRTIATWTGELALGMALFTGLDRGSGWTSLATLDDLAAYEYYVAGTVGRMLDALIGGPPRRAEDRRSRERAVLAVHFGRGLQATNILQDLSVDRARGWCYLPEEVARRHGTSTDRLHLAREADRAMGAVREIARQAAADLDDGLEYLLGFPRRRFRVRLFCLWPLLLALRTLALVCSGPATLSRRVRIGREEARKLAGEARARAVSNAAVRALCRRERSRLVPLLDGEPAGPPAGEDGEEERQ